MEQFTEIPFTAYTLLIAAWVTYFAAHSLLATTAVKEKLPIPAQYYRLFYNLFAFFSLAALLLFIITIPPHWLWPQSFLSRFVGLMLATYAIILFKISFRSYSLREFLGLSQLQEGDNENQVFKKDGILAYVRHPLYLATLFLVGGYFLFSPTLANLINLICITVYIFVGIYFEEQKLVKAFGQAYRQYQQEVPMLIPRKLKG
jgi:protein-S-isoprenylcysteine O-methyltransferase Ste14